MQNYFIKTLYSEKHTNLDFDLILQMKQENIILFISKLNLEQLTMLEGLETYKEVFAAIKDMNNIDIALHPLRPIRPIRPIPYMESSQYN